MHLYLLNCPFLLYIIPQNEQNVKCFLHIFYIFFAAKSTPFDCRATEQRVQIADKLKQKQRL